MHINTKFYVIVLSCYRRILVSFFGNNFTANYGVILKIGTFTDFCHKHTKCLHMLPCFFY